MKKLPDPLPTETLRELTKAAPAPEVRALLWEIYRLRALVVQANAVLWEVEAGCLVFEWDDAESFKRLLRQLAKEPAVIEAAKRRQPTKRETEFERRARRG